MPQLFPLLLGIIFRGRRQAALASPATPVAFGHRVPEHGRTLTISLRSRHAYPPRRGSGRRSLNPQGPTYLVRHGRFVLSLDDVLCLSCSG
ncbi:hypothetical protein B0T11DRAFT_277317 [Plectosphaerella cucumerina]|uniref:Uncharacterized protein n=1 Tax=Plectosphaerella cucumerina TaxID=40658 RepID=A0A8K0X836_9PEZI|nr:hypothetical protein B0T11DRAFT_277317 [Plectosphaerella cucumerina]